jgi:hypothetical protein
MSPRNVATVLTDVVMIVSMLNHVHKCLNNMLVDNGYGGSDVFADVVVACFEASLIDEYTSFACVALSDERCKLKYNAGNFLLTVFGQP